MSDQVNRFLGDSIGRTIIKLLVVSLIVGFVMAIFGIHLWRQGFSALGRVGDYLLLGATIVIPIFIIIRLFSYRK
jgi:hypothetical protein